MANPEVELLVKVISDANFGALHDSGIDIGFFNTAEGMALYRFVRDHFHNEEHYGETPSLTMAKRRNPTLHLQVPRDSLSSLVQEVSDQRFLRDFDLMVDSAGALVDGGDHRGAVQHLRAQLQKWERTQSAGGDLDMADVCDQLKEDYEKAEVGGGMLGIPTPWTIFNESTMGLQGGDYMLIYGRPGTMKTWIACVIAVYAYEHGRRVLFFSAEMVAKKIAHRLAALLTGVDWSDYRHGRLHPALKSTVFTYLDTLTALQSGELNDDGRSACLKISTGKGVVSGKSVDTIRAKVEEYKPDLVICDGIYLLSASARNQAEKLTKISNALRDLANDAEVPLIGVTQANRDARKGRGDDVGELAHSDALGQDATIALRVIRHFHPEFGEYVLTHSFSKGRDEGIPPYVIHAQPARDFSFLERSNSLRVQDAVKEETTTMGEDDPEDGDAPPGTKPTRGHRGRAKPRERIKFTGKPAQ
jgi:KaiC/GvpD/RAD55 family RecA-like ATPase